MGVFYFAPFLTFQFLRFQSNSRHVIYFITYHNVIYLYNEKTQNTAFFPLGKKNSNYR